MCAYTLTPGDIVEDALEEYSQQGELNSGEIPVECVGSMPINWSAARATVCIGTQSGPEKIGPLGAQPSLATRQHHVLASINLHFIFPLCPRKKDPLEGSSQYYSLTTRGPHLKGK